MEERSQETLRLLGLLAEARLDYVVIGGVAASVWGSTLYTDDLDCASRRRRSEDCSRHCARSVRNIDDLIAVKESVARPKDIQTAVQLRAIRSTLDRP